MIFFKKKKIKEEETSESSLDAPEILPEALTDDPDEVDTPVEQSPADDTAPDFPVTEPLGTTEEPPVIPAVNGEESVSPQADENIASAEETEDAEVTDCSMTSPDSAGEDAEAAEDAEDTEEDTLNDFERSIRDFSADDIDATVKSGEKKRDMVRLAVMVLCVCVFIYSTSYLIRNIHDKIKSDRIYADIIDSVADGFGAEGTVSAGGKVDLLAADVKTAYTPTMDEIIKNGAGEVTTQSDHSAELAKMRASLESLRNINPEIYAWIKVPGTNINYPVAKTDNNEYYLDHAYTGDNLVNGSIYADFRCVLPITANYNTVLYGHNVTSGSMFNHVTHFFKPEVFENTNIYIYTFDGIYVFKPFSIHEAAYDSGYIDMGFSEEEFVAFATSLQEMSDVKSDVTFTPMDRIITLSTCTNGISTQRYALHGVLIETITE